MYQAKLVFSTFVYKAQALWAAFTQEAIEPFFSLRLFEIPFQAQVRIFSVYHMSDFLLTMLSLAGLLILWRRYEIVKESKGFHLYIFSLLIAPSFWLAYQAAAWTGLREYVTFIKPAIIFAPFFVGVVLWRLDQCFNTTALRRKAKSHFLAALVFLIVSLSLIQFFPSQPLVPRSSVLGSNLPQDEYIYNFQHANSVYKMRMISFAERYSPQDARITSDYLTRIQIQNFAEKSFYFRHTLTNPLTPDWGFPYNVVPYRDTAWNLFLLHWGGKSGSLGEPAEYRTKAKIREFRERGEWSVIYDNGESFIIWKP